jgi:transglutaminase-like putative cysteine protease
MTPKGFLKLSGLVGAGLIAFGLYMSFREKKQRGLAGHRYIQGRFEEAPIVDSYSDGEMTTVLRASEDMPIQQRIASIQKMVEKSVQDPQMRALAAHITQGCPERDGMCEAKKIYKAVKKRVRYVGDIAPIKMSNGQTEGIDLYQSARRTWEMGIGDCDDQTILIETLLSSIGIQAKSRVTAETSDADDGHIYPVALLPKFSPEFAVALDTTLPGSGNFGVEAPAGRITDFDA